MFGGRHANNVLCPSFSGDQEVKYILEMLISIPDLKLSKIKFRSAEFSEIFIEKNMLKSDFFTMDCRDVVKTGLKLLNDSENTEFQVIGYTKFTYLRGDQTRSPTHTTIVSIIPTYLAVLQNFTPYKADNSSSNTGRAVLNRRSQGVFQTITGTTRGNTTSNQAAAAAITTTTTSPQGTVSTTVATGTTSGNTTTQTTPTTRATTTNQTTTTTSTTTITTSGDVTISTSIANITAASSSGATATTLPTVITRARDQSEEDSQTRAKRVKKQSEN